MIAALAARPRLAVGAVLLVIAACLPLLWPLQLGAGLRDLALRDEPAQALERQWAERFGDRDFLVVLFQPRGDLLAPANLAALDALQRELAALSGVARVSGLLDVALPGGEPLAFDAVLAGDWPTLRNRAPDDAASRRALLHHPLYRELLIGRSGTLTALQITAAGSDAAALVAPVRSVLARHAGAAELHLSGPAATEAAVVAQLARELPAVAALFALLAAVALLGWLRHPLWLLLPLLSLAFAGLPLLAATALLGWALTPLLLGVWLLLALLALQQGAHFARCYRGQAGPVPMRALAALQRWRGPALLSALAAALPFAALALLPVPALARAGLLLAPGALLVWLGTALLAVPLLTLPPHPPLASAPSLPPLSGNRRAAALALFGALLLAALLVLPQLRPAQHLLDHFRDDSGLRRTLALVDAELGGSEPLQMLLTAAPASAGPRAESDPFADDAFADFAAETGDAGHWFRRAGLQRLAAVEATVATLPAAGKVLSLTALQQLLRETLAGEPDDIQLALAQRQLPALPRELLLQPFLDDDAPTQTRLLLRLHADAAQPVAAAVTELRDRLEVGLGLAPAQIAVAGAALAHARLQEQLPVLLLRGVGMALALQLLLALVWTRSLRAALWLPLPGLCGVLAAFGAMAAFGGGIALTAPLLALAPLALGAAGAAQRLAGERAAGVTLLPAALALPALLLSAFVPALQLGLFGAVGLVAAALAALLLPAPGLLPLHNPDDAETQP
jgi:predicted RND superfamily exporter protein